MINYNLTIYPAIYNAATKVIAAERPTARRAADNKPDDTVIAELVEFAAVGDDLAPVTVTSPAVQFINTPRTKERESKLTSNSLRHLWWVRLIIVRLDVRSGYIFPQTADHGLDLEWRLMGKCVRQDVPGRDLDSLLVEVVFEDDETARAGRCVCHDILPVVENLMN